MTKLTKVEGAKERCHCGASIVCFKINKGTQDEKLQWQDPILHRPHYNFDKLTKTVSCNIAIEPQSVIPLNTIPLTLEARVAKLELDFNIIKTQLSGVIAK
jgi:hypothetical protein